MPPSVHPLNVEVDQFSDWSIPTIHPESALSSFGTDFLLRRIIELDSAFPERRFDRESRSGIEVEPVQNAAAPARISRLHEVAEYDGDTDSVSTLDLSDVRVASYGSLRGSTDATASEFAVVEDDYVGPDIHVGHQLSAVSAGVLAGDDDVWRYYDPVIEGMDDDVESSGDGSWYDPRPAYRTYLGLFVGFDIFRGATILGAAASAAGYFQGVPVGVPGVVKFLWNVKAALTAASNLFSVAVIMKPLSYALGLPLYVAKGCLVLTLKLHFVGCVKLACAVSVAGLGVVGLITVLLLAMHTFVLHFAFWYGTAAVSNVVLCFARVLLVVHAWVLCVVHSAFVWYVLLPYKVLRGALTLVTLGRF